MGMRKRIVGIVKTYTQIEAEKYVFLYPYRPQNRQPIPKPDPTISGFGFPERFGCFCHPYQCLILIA